MASKTEQKRLWPNVPTEVLMGRSQALQATAALLQDELTRLGDGRSPHFLPDGQKAMWAAHLTVTLYVTENLLRLTEQEIKLSQQMDNLRLATVPLVDARGRRLTKN